MHPSPETITTTLRKTSKDTIIVRQPKGRHIVASQILILNNDIDLKIPKGNNVTGSIHCKLPIIPFPIIVARIVRNTEDNSEFSDNRPKNNVVNFRYCLALAPMPSATRFLVY